MVDIVLIGAILCLIKYCRKAAKNVTNSLPFEHAEQIGFVQWFRARWPRVLIFAIPNGGKRNIATAKRLHREGVVPGIPDLFIPAWGIWIEMKRQKGGRLSPEQKAVVQYLESIGHQVIVGYGAMDASDKLLQLLKMDGAADEGGRRRPETQ
jgi:hypothetical protein